MSIQEKQDQIIEEFSIFEDWMEKYEHIIQYGKTLPAIDSIYKNEEHLIKGCQSRVWLHAELVGDTLRFTADSDAIITKGLIALLIEVLDGHSPEEVAGADIYFINQLGLASHLSPTRANGLLSMLKQIKMYAIAYAKMNQK